MLLALADLKEILIKATYTTVAQQASLVSASLEIADERGVGERAAHVEQCQCPLGYLGTSCEDCAPGYTRYEMNFIKKLMFTNEPNNHSTHMYVIAEHLADFILVFVNLATAMDIQNNATPKLESARYFSFVEKNYYTFENSNEIYNHLSAYRIVNKILEVLHATSAKSDTLAMPAHLTAVKLFLAI